MTDDSRGTGARPGRPADVVTRPMEVDPDASAQFLHDDPDDGADPGLARSDRSMQPDHSAPYDQGTEPVPSGRTPSAAIGSLRGRDGAATPSAEVPPARPRRPIIADSTGTDITPVRRSPAVPVRPDVDGGAIRHAGTAQDERAPRFLTRLIAVVLAVLIGLAGGAVALTWLLGRTASGLNPFDETTVDRSGPPVLRSLTDLQRFQAAEGYYEVVIDQEKDVANLPSFLAGERTIFVAAGSVDAVVDFSGLGDGNVTTDADRTTITVRLPAVEVGQPQLDLDRSYVANQQRGLRDRLEDALGATGGSANTEELYRLAQQRIAQEAGRSDDLRSRAEANTRAMLTSLLQQAGYTSVTVTFAPTD